MGISLVPSHSPKWYARSNLGLALVSLCVVGYYGVFEYVLTSRETTLPIDLEVAVFALAHFVFGVTLFFAIASKAPRVAGLIGHLLYMVAAGFIFWSTKDQTNDLFLMFVAGAAVSGLFGRVYWFLINASIGALLVLEISSRAAGLPGIDELSIAIFVAMSVGSLMLWSGLSPAQDGAEPVKPAKKLVGSSKAELKSAIGNMSSEILTNSITDGVAIINTGGTIMSFNPSAQQITGWSADEAIGLDYHSVIILVDQHDQAYTDKQNAITQSLATGTAYKDNNAKLMNRANKSLFVDILASPIINNKNVSASVVIFRDVSKQKMEERQRAEFISTASHEMRTPVAAIEGYLALAMNDKVSKIDTVARGYLDKAHTSTQHLGRLFQDLLTAAKSEDGRLTNNPVVVEVGQLLDELIEGARFTAEKKGLLMEADFRHTDAKGQVVSTKSEARSASTIRPLAYVHADPERMREVITNLFDNAVKYTEEGKISIGMHTEDKTITIKVSDTGAGIPKEDVPHLFQKFYRVDNSATRQVGGTGLGLFICRKIIELYNGRIWVESELGSGSTFNVSLPRLTSERAQELIRQEALQSQNKGAA